jgi:CTP:molybdopterin cytidylyltransferase MocA
MGVSKASLQYRGRTFLQAIIEASTAAGLSPCCVVVAEDHHITLPDNALQGVLVVRNPDVSTGPIGSAVLGVRAVLNHPVDAALLWHVDQPHVAVSTVQALADRFRARGAAIVVPSYRGRWGHPIIVGREVFPEVLASPGNGLREVVRAVPERVAVVELEDPAVLEDIDTPEDYERLVRREGLH